MKAKKVKKGVIPAAGAGSRLGYLSSLLPKTLFPIYDRPIIHHVVDQMHSIGIEDIYIIINVHKEKVKEYFELYALDIHPKIHFIEQTELGGTAAAIKLAEKYINDEPFLVTYGDDCTITDSYQNFLDIYDKNDAVVVEGVVKEYDLGVLSQTCSVKLDKKNRMIEIIEKPEKPPYKMRGCGVYLFSPEIFNYIDKTPVHPVRREKEITYTINSIAKDGRAYGALINGYNINVNDYDQLLKAGHLVKMLKESSL